MKMPNYWGADVQPVCPILQASLDWVFPVGQAGLCMDLCMGGVLVHGGWGCS